MAKKDVNITVSMKDLASDGFKKLTGNMKDVEKGLGSLAFKYSDVIAGALSGAALKNIVDSTVKWGSAVNGLVDATGMADSEASRWLYTCQAVGLTTEDVTSVTGIFSGKLMEARDAIKSASAAGKESDDIFSRYGITIMDAKGNLLGYEQILQSVIHLHRTMGNGIEKTNLERMIFGKSRMKMNDLLNLTNDQLEQFAEKCRKAGLEMKDSSSAAAKEYTFAVNELDLALEGLKVQLGQELLPVMKDSVDVVADLVRQYKDLPEPTKEAINAFGGLTAALAALSVAIRTALYLGGPLLAMLSAMGAPVAAGTAIAGAFAYSAYQQQQQMEETGVASYRDEMTGEWVGVKVGPSKDLQDSIARSEDYFLNHPEGSNPLKNQSSVNETLIRDKVGSGGGKTDKAAKEHENAMRKLQKVLRDINKEIAEETGSIFDSEALAIREEITKLQLEIKAAERLGIDVSEAREKIGQYEKVMTEKNEREQRRRTAEFYAEMLGLDSEYYHNNEKLIESNYLMQTAALEEELHKKVRQIGDKAQADEWYSKKRRLLDLQYQKDLSEEERASMQRQIDRIGILGELEGKTQNEITRIRKSALEEQIILLQKQLEAESLNADERLRIEQDLASAIRSLREENGKDPGQAFSEGWQRIRDQQHDYAADVVNTWNSLFGSFEENIASAIDGSKSFSEAMKDMADSVIKDMTRMFVKMMINKIMMNAFGMGGGGSSTSEGSGGGLSGIFGSISGIVGAFPGFASGGRAYPGQTIVVGEDGPELMRVGYQSEIIPNGSFSSGSGVTPNVSINIQNNGGNEMQVSESSVNYDRQIAEVGSWYCGR